MSENNKLEDIIPNLSSDLSVSFEIFFDLVKRYNTTINLVAKSTISKAWTKHFADSFLGLEQIRNDLVTDQPILDFGSGNGFPGIIAALTLKNYNVILVERDLRKSEFLKAAVDHLGLKNCEVHAGTVNELTEASCFNVISRAMAPLPKFLLEARYVMAPGGNAFVFKGEHWSTEFTAIPAQLFEHWEIDLHSSYELPENEGSRFIVRCTRI